MNLKIKSKNTMKAHFLGFKLIPYSSHFKNITLTWIGVCPYRCKQWNHLEKSSWHNLGFFSGKKTTTISKKRRFYKWALNYFFNFLFFGNVSWTTNMRPYGRWKIIIYTLYVH
jgi:hypothetical protein